MKRLIIILTIWLITDLCIYAQEITLKVEAPGVVAVGEQFRISWIANTRGGEFQVPDLEDFYVLSGPQTSYSQSTQIINNKVTSTVSNTYTYFVQATKEGKYIIPPGKFVYKKKEYLSDPLEIEVVSEGQNINRQSQTNRPGAESANESVSSNDLYVRLKLNKNEVYLGEHIVASLKIYSRVNISGIQEIKYPDFQSFLKEDLETPPLRALERENINGSIYGTGIIQKFLIYPQRTGTITIEPANLTILLQQKSRSNDPFFGDFFSTFTTVPKMIATLPVDIEVKPLPAGAPDSFDGVVGNITLSSEINADTVNVNDAVTYRIILRGQGNLKLATAPELNLPPDIEIYEPKISSDLDVTTSGTTGSRIFEYVLIPRYHGNFKIPAIKYSFFDPSKGQYSSMMTTEHSFVALQTDEADEGAEVYGGMTKENVRFLGKDIRYIITGKPKFRSSGNNLLRNHVFLYSFPGLLIVFFLIIILRREQIKRNSDIARVRNRKAAGIASKRLKKADECLRENDTEGFYAELLKAIWGYLSDKFNIPLSELSSDIVSKVLEKNKLDEEIIKDLNHVINKCEYSRYSPDSELSTADDVYKKAEIIIKNIENN